MKRSLVAVLFIAVVWLAVIGLSLPLTAQALDRVDSLEPQAVVSAMIEQVQSSQVYNYDAQLSGAVPALIGGVPYTITTRNTGSGVPLQQATQFVFEHLQRQGLAVSYHNWTNCSRSNRNVIGVLTGTLTPNEIVLITAHLDDMPASGLAPGADDNASGSVGVMLAAEIMSRYRFERTLRFVFFTGEEQGLCGSEVYADAVAASGDNIVAVYNMDMIAYDATGDPTLRLHTRTTSNSGYAADLAIAGIFTNVVNAYGMSGVLTPLITADGENRSDHSSFWDQGYAAILAIEDDYSDFNDYYHTVNDNLSHINLTYFTNFVKASVGTAAHLARPLSAVLQGTVSDINTTLPISGAHIVATAGVTRTGSAVTNSSGQYYLPLLDGRLHADGHRLRVCALQCHRGASSSRLHHDAKSDADGGDLLHRQWADQRRADATTTQRYDLDRGLSLRPDRNQSIRRVSRGAGQRPNPYPARQRQSAGLSANRSDDRTADKRSGRELRARP